MSKRKDRLNTSYRYCPICGHKQISVKKFGKLFPKYCICCWKCKSNIFVKGGEKF